MKGLLVLLLLVGLGAAVLAAVLVAVLGALPWLLLVGLVLVAATAAWAVCKVRAVVGRD